MIGMRVKSAELSRAISKGGVVETAAKIAVTLSVREDTKQYVPYVTGDLRGTAETESVPEQGLLVYGNASVPYARPQYYGLPSKTWPGTYMQWFAPSKAANLTRWIKVAGSAAGGVCNGK